MNVYLIAVLVILIGKYFLTWVVEILNLRYLSLELPQELVGYYDAQKYQKSQAYLKENTNFKLLKDAVVAVITLIFILAGGFNFIDRYARSFGQQDILTGLIFAGILMLAGEILSIPFSVYRTFIIEAKYGFNRTTGKTFLLDIVKNLILGALIGGITFSFILWFFAKIGKWAWLYCWLSLIGLELFLVFIAPVIIMPLFNKFIPLEEGEFKTEIEDYAKSQNFHLKGIFKIDASRRSNKSNAFFIGFGRYRRIALFDTLIQKHTVNELVSVLAHEIGHYKRKHFLKNIALSITNAGVLFFILSFFINNKGLFSAFKMDRISIYASLFFFAFLYTPINLAFTVLANFFSRRYEYEADAFAVETYKNPEAMISALKKLAVNNLSNLRPHPVKVFLDYSHPPVLKRIEAIKKIGAER